jgi:PAS domain S-box-containing protein
MILIRDIGDRKQIEREREQLLRTIDHDRRRLDAILRQVPNTLIVFDTEGRIVVANDALSSSLNLPMGDVVGNRTSDFGTRYISPDGVALTRDELPSSRALRGDEFEGEMRVERPDGRSDWLHVSAAPVRDEHGTITGAILATRNTTAERLALEALKTNEGRHRALLDAIPDSIYVNDGDGTILDYKPPRDGRPMIPDDAFVGRRVDEIWPRETSNVILELTRKTLDTGQTQAVEYQIPTPLGPAYREARCVPYGPNEVLALVRDVDVRKRAEIALRSMNHELERRVQERTAALQDANSQLEAFSYSVSHDLKAPLRGVDGYSRLLWEDYRDRLDDDGRFLLGSVRQAAAQMHQLIDDLLAYSRLERRAIDGAELEILPIVEGLLAERADEIRERSVHVELTAPAATVLADRDGFAQAFRNLLDNALRFTAQSPEPRIDVGGTAEPGTYTLWVRDNGISFDMGYHDRIFEIFQRLHRQDEYPGTGIGLALVRKAMQRMGGRVWAESRPGSGATFYLEVPR